MKRVLPLIAAGLVLVLILVLSVVSSAASASSAACLPESVAVVGTVPTSANLDVEQQQNAQTIVSVAVQRRMPTRAAVIAIATAMQESTLRNLAHGDRDSLGLFQQRPSQGWGEPLQLMDPVYSTNAFLDRLQEVDDWPLLPVTVAAQAVQRSAFPDAYARWEPLASSVVAALLGRPADEGSADQDQTVTDGPGLLVLGDNLTAAFDEDWPATFHGGPVVVDVAGGRTTQQGLAALRARDADGLPGTLVVSLGGRDGVTAATRDEYAARVRGVLDLAGADRTVHWLTWPFRGGDEANATLRSLAESDKRLNLIDVDAEVEEHPGWLTSESTLTSAGLDSVSALVVDRLGSAGAGVPAQSAIGEGCNDGVGGYSGVPVADCTFVLPRSNPRTCQDAIRWGLAQQDGPARWYRRCLNFVAQTYGYSFSGVPKARDFWFTADPSIQHPGDVNPPAGALVFWNNGSAGHVALSAGNGMVISNDIRGHGTIALVPLAEITTRWNAPYLGWTDPFFPKAG